VSARMSRQSAGSAAGFVSSAVGIVEAYKGSLRRGKPSGAHHKLRLSPFAPN
jgi:hypothetical protein